MTRAIRRFLLGRCRGPGLPDRRESDLTHYVKSLKNLISSQRRGIGGGLLRADSREGYARWAKHDNDQQNTHRKRIMTLGVDGKQNGRARNSTPVKWTSPNSA